MSAMRVAPPAAMMAHGVLTGVSMRWIRGLTAVAVAVAGATVGAVLQPTPAAAQVWVDAVPVDGWDVNGRVLATRIVGDVVYVGGSFTAAVAPDGTSVPRKNLAAFSMRTGALVTTWRADAGAEVTAIDSDGQALYVAGHFGRVNNVVRQRVAKLSLATGAVDPAFSAAPDAGVRTLAVDDGSLYLGGRFLNVNGARRDYLAKVSATTGALDPGFRPVASGAVFSIVAHPTRDVLFAAGAFDRLNGVARNGVGAVDGSTGATTGPAYASSVRPTLALDVDDTGTRLFGAGATGANVMSAWDTGTGARVWRVYTMGDNQATAHHRGTVLVGFHDGYAGNTQLKVLAIDAATGAVDPAFRPEIPDFWGVLAIDASDAGVVIGGDFTSVGGVPLRSFALFDPGARP